MERLEDLLTITTVAEKLEISEFSVKEMEKKGLTVHRIGRLKRYREQEVIKFITEGKS